MCMKQEELKEVQEVFKDYRTINKELLKTKIISMNLFKKTNSLKINLLSDKYLKIREIESFENYLKVRFGIQEINTVVELTNRDEIQNEHVCETNEMVQPSILIEKEWNDIVEYLSCKHPLTKAILRDSSISIDENAANVLLSFKGKSFIVI